MPARTDATTLSLHTGSPDETGRLGAALASVLRTGDVLVLTGDLGAGKTRLTQGIGRGLGIDDRLTSPTFTLANRYQGRDADGADVLLHHLDVYRLVSPADSLDLDLPGLVESGLTVIEWGEQVAAQLRVDHLVITISFPPPAVDRAVSDVVDDEDERRFTIEPVGDDWSNGSRWDALTSVLSPWTP